MLRDPNDPTEDWDGSYPGGSGRRRLALTRASDIKVRPVRWLWDGRVALGTLCLVGGREGIGKSTCVYQWTGDITQGRLPGVNHGTPRPVIVCATEDSWEHTIVPRLMAAGADLHLVYRIEVTTSDGLHGALTLPLDNEQLESAIGEIGAAAVVFDPLLSRLSSALDTHKDAEVRKALEPLVAIADRTGTAMFGLIHVNKSVSTDPLTMLMASRAFAAVARSVLFVALDPSDETRQRRFVGQAKNNLGSDDLPTLAFTIDGAKVADTDEGPVWTGRVAWQGEDARSIGQILQVVPESSGERTEKLGAAGWLSDYLSLHGVVESVVVKAAAKEYGHKDRTLQRAREDLGVGITPFGFPRRTWWSAPGMTPDEVTAWLEESEGDQSCQPHGETHHHGMTGITEGRSRRSTPVVPVVPSLLPPEPPGTTSPEIRDAA